jgi:hypothetical protein
MEPEGSLPFSQQPAIGPYPDPNDSVLPTKRRKEKTRREKIQIKKETNMKRKENRKKEKNSILSITQNPVTFRLPFRLEVPALKFPRK